jgi:hypothetical protein
MSHGKPDPLEVQVSIKLRVPKHIPQTAITAALADEIVRYRIEHGKDHPRAKTRIIQWRNPGRRGSFRRWRTGNQEDAWATLGRALGAGGLSVSQVDE